MEFHEVLDAWDETRGNAVLATVIGVEGHAYRKEGASMLLYADGRRVGAISPGCLEADVMERVPDIAAGGPPQTVEYDMRDADDWAWGETVGCGGKITVLLESVEGRLADALTELLSRLRLGEACCLVRRRQSKAARSAFMSGTGAAGAPEGLGRHEESGMPGLPGESRGPEMWGMPGVLDASLEYEVEAVSSGEAATGWEDDGFRLLCEPKPRLLIFGAGADAEPLAALAAASGFRVVVADWRESLCCPGHFPGCGTFVGSPVEAVERLGVSESDYVVVMSHHPGRDRQCLQALWPRAARYVGVLGSKARTRRLLEGMNPPPWLHWPIGLAIGAVGPQEIAVSVVAELIAVRRRADIRGERGSALEGGGAVFGSRSKPANGSPQAVHPARG
ncbi:XdhC family protein [Paenibacillus validus]|uniref:XdhC family protein n=2 Tax=Paenibacillus validus TaxID=44253 RepID=UPI000FD7D95C|nr:XdhC family protein [Paenibacillus validus]